MNYHEIILPLFSLSFLETRENPPLPLTAAPHPEVDSFDRLQ